MCIAEIGYFGIELIKSKKPISNSSHLVYFLCCSVYHDYFDILFIKLIFMHMHVFRHRDGPILRKEFSHGPWKRLIQLLRIKREKDCSPPCLTTDNRQWAINNYPLAILNCIYFSSWPNFYSMAEAQTAVTSKIFIKKRNHHTSSPQFSYKTYKPSTLSP